MKETLREQLSKKTLGEQTKKGGMNVTTILKVGKEARTASFYLDEKERKILQIEIFDKMALEINFPGVTEDDFTYAKLESIMKYYMGYDGNASKKVTLTDILKEIEEDGFFFGIKPALHLSVERK